MSFEPSLRSILYFLATSIFLTNLSGCKSGSEATTEADSLQMQVVSDSIQKEGTDGERYEGEGGFDAPREIIRYGGVVTDQKENDLRRFQRLQDVMDQVQIALKLRDSLFYARGSDQVGGPLDDSIRATATFKNAWRAIDEYKQIMEPGYPFDDGIPNLLDLTRTLHAGDSSQDYLPAPGKSSLLAKGDYFLLGGAPFIDAHQSDEGGAFESPDGKLELRFTSSVTENANYILNFLLHMKTSPMEIGYGAPLRMYDGWRRDVNGVGAIIHNFKPRVPVFFLTTKGAIPAEMISVTVKLDGEGLGCVSDQPLMTFACRENISAYDILAVYISANTKQKISFRHKVHNNALWTADLDNDGIDDLACVSSSFEGIADDRMAELLWFVNVSGEWKIIDYARMLDCT